MENFKKHDTLIGTVIGCNSYGCYVRDDASEKVVFYYGNGMSGDRVQLSIQKVDLARDRITCVLDSVIEYSGFAA